MNKVQRQDVDRVRLTLIIEMLGQIVVRLEWFQKNQSTILST